MDEMNSKRNKILSVILLIVKIIISIVYVLFTIYMIYMGISSYRLDIINEEVNQPNFIVYFTLIVLLISFITYLSMSIVSLIACIISLTCKNIPNRKINIIGFAVLTVLPLITHLIIFLVSNFLCR